MWEIHLPLLILLCPSHLGDFSHYLGGSKSKNQKEGSCTKMDLMRKSIRFMWLVSLQNLLLFPFLPANSTREALCLPVCKAGFFLSKEQGPHQLPFYLVLHPAYLMEKNKWFTMGTWTWEKTWNKSVWPSIQVFTEKELIKRWVTQKSHRMFGQN